MQIQKKAMQCGQVIGRQVFDRKRREQGPMTRVVGLMLPKEAAAKGKRSRVNQFSEY